MILDRLCQNLSLNIEKWGRTCSCIDSFELRCFYWKKGTAIMNFYFINNIHGCYCEFRMCTKSYKTIFYKLDHPTSVMVTNATLFRHPSLTVESMSESCIFCEQIIYG